MHTLKLLRKEVKEATGCNINNPRRKREYVYARALYYRLSKEFTTCSLSDIGKSVGKDHATVLHGLRTFEEVITKEEPQIMRMYYQIREKHDVGEEVTELNDPIGYWKKKYEDLKDKYYEFGEDYKQVQRRNLFMKGVLEKRGYKYMFMKEEMKEFEEI